MIGLRVAMVVASDRIVGGHSVQASRLSSALAADDVRVDRIDIDPVWPRLLAPLRRIRGVKTAINEVLYAWSLRRLRRADVAHVFSASYWSFLLAPVPAMIAARLVGARVVLHYHSGEVDDHLSKWGWLVHPWLRLADVIVVCSEFQRRVFARHGYDAVVIPNVMDPAQVLFRSRRPLRPRLLSNRNLEAHYGVDVILDAFPWIREKRPDATLVIAGGGSEDARLKARAARVGTKGITFVGQIAPHEMAPLLDDADVLVNASRVDNQPLSLIEAAAAGVAIVSTPTGAIPEMLDGGTSGVLVPHDDPRALAAAVLDLIDAPARAEVMARAARDGVARYEWPALRPLWAAAYHGSPTPDVEGAASGAGDRLRRHASA